MNQGKMISVVIPTYNRRELILDAVKSVTDQTYQNLEVIVVDDGSTDKTYELFENETLDPRIKFYRYENNSGGGYARNYGVHHSHGEYIAFQDSDDVWMKNKLEKELTLLIDKDADVVFCGMNRTVDQSTQYFPFYDYNDQKDAVGQLLMCNSISTQTMLLKKSLFNTVKFDVEFKRSQDWDLALQIAEAGFKIAYLHEALVNAYVRPDSITSTANYFEALNLLINKHDVSYSRYPEIRNHLMACIFSAQAHSLKGIDKEKQKELLLKSYKYEKSCKTLLKLIFSRFGIY